MGSVIMKLKEQCEETPDETPEETPRRVVNDKIVIL